MKAVVLTCEDCGHSTPLTSPKVAAYGMRRHSCATVRERAARKQRRLDKLALAGPKQPCPHGAHHTHGTRACYVFDRCKCRPCKDANRTYEQARAKRLAYGRHAYVNAAPARAHIRNLTAAGMGLKRIVEVSDISHGLLWKLMYGKTRPDGSRTPSKRIRPATEAKILAITPDLADGAKIDSTGSTRRIQALVACGWSMSKIAARLGIGRSNFTPLAQGHRGTTVAHAKAVSDLYDQLWDQTPPHAEWRDHIAYSRALNYAAAAGWAPPLAWDEDDIDNPDALPDLGQQNKVASGGRVHVEDIEFLAGTGLTLDQVADRLHVIRSAIEHACARGERRDLLTQMDRRH